MGESLFKKQLSVGETAFFQCETPILVCVLMCSSSHGRPCLEQDENRRIVAFPGVIVACSLSLAATLASVAMLLS